MTRMASAWPTPLLGRAEELARLRSMLDAAGSGRTQVAVIAGAAGLGKSRLVDCFVEQIDGPVLTGACLPLGSDGVPFAPILAIARDLSTDPAAAEVLPPGLAALVPGTNEAAEPMTPLGVYQGVIALLAQATEPVTMVVEDVHWADHSTLDLLSMLVTNVRELRLLLVLTYRSDDIHREHPWRTVMAEMQRFPWVERFDLAPFDSDLVADQIRSLTGAPPAPETLVAALARTEGNPFYVEQLVAAGGLTSAGLPDSLRELLLARADVVPEETRRTLRIMSLADGDVDDESLARVAGQPVTAVRAHLREALDAQLLVTTDRGVRFGHALMREALESDLLPGERTAFHRAFADELAVRLAGRAEQRADLLARLAHHRAGQGDVDEAVTAWARAANAAERLGGYAETAHHLQRIIEHWGNAGDPERLVGAVYEAVVARAAECAFVAGDAPLACRLAEEALRLIDVDTRPARAGLLHERLARYSNSVGDHDRALALCTRAVELVPAAPPSAERARVLAGLAGQLMLRNRYDEARSVALEAAEIGRATGATVAVASALNTLGVVECELVDLESGLARMQEARRIAADAESAHEQMRSLWNTVGRLHEAAEWERAADAFEQARVVLPQLGQAHELPELARSGAEVQFRLGRWADAEQLVAEFQAWFPHLSDEVELVDLLIARGQFDHARSTLARQFERAAFPDPELEVFALAARAEIEVWEGDLEAARRTVAEALALGMEGEPRLGVANTLAVGCRAEADAATRTRSVKGVVSVDDERLDRYLGAFDTLIAQPGPDLGWKREARALASHGRAEANRARRHADPSAWAAATDAWNELRMPYPAAYTEFRTAEALVAGGDRRSADVLARRAHDTAVSLGADPLRALIEAFARRARLTVAAAATPTAFGGLTPRELEVVAILGVGATNREIAEAMYISEKTASVHVTNILRKLGVSNRNQVVAIAHREGLVDR